MIITMNGIEDFCRSLNDFYEAVYLHRNWKMEIDSFAEIEEAEQNGNDVFLYLHFWTKYGQIIVDKKYARAGWSKQIKNNGITITFHLHFNQISMYQQIVSVDIFQRGHIGKATFLIDDEGVSFENEYADEESYQTAVCYMELECQFTPVLYYDRQISPYNKNVGILMNGAITSMINIIQKQLQIAFGNTDNTEPQ